MRVGENWNKKKKRTRGTQQSDQQFVAVAPLARTPSGFLNAVFIAPIVRWPPPPQRTHNFAPFTQSPYTAHSSKRKE